jgi:hypothetical protein
MQNLQEQLKTTRDKFEQLKGGLFELGKQILDYKNVYSVALECEVISGKLLDLLPDTASKVTTSGKKPDNIAKVLIKLYHSLDRSLNRLNARVKPEDLKREDYAKLSKILNDINRKQGSIDSDLTQRDYKSVRSSLSDINAKLDDIGTTVSDSMYGLVKNIIDNLK